MGTTLGKMFIDPAAPIPCNATQLDCGGVIPDDGYGWVQLLFLFFAYGYVLYFSSGLISDGSELLLLIPSMSGIVGSVVLPVLGAVPDGAIVLFSGLGANAQEQLSVGVGALAGSTIMLLTIPWCLSVFAGRVNLENGVGTYVKPKGMKGSDWVGKLNPPNNMALVGTGVCVKGGVKTGGYAMLLTMLPYFIIQGSAFASKCYGKTGNDCDGHGEHWWALIGLIYCVLAFLFYLYYQIRSSNSDNKVAKVEQVRREAIVVGRITFTTAYKDIIREYSKSGGAEALLLAEQKNDSNFKTTLRSFFNKYDADGDHTISKTELPRLLDDLGVGYNAANVDRFMTIIDLDGDGKICFSEFAKCMMKAILFANGKIEVPGGFPAYDKDKKSISPRGDQLADKLAASLTHRNSHINDIDVLVAEGDNFDSYDNNDEEEEEEEEIPEDLTHLNYDQQMMRIKLRSAWMMGLGTLLVLVFSDPMVDILSQIGIRMGISPFYVAFVLGPLASNASELIASYNYALKKTRTTITLSLSALCGAACMNNTFCLAIFLALIFFKGLVWEYSAETISILVVEILMFFFAAKPTQNLRDALFVITLFPLSIALVAIIESTGLN